MSFIIELFPHTHHFLITSLPNSVVARLFISCRHSYHSGALRCCIVMGANKNTRSGSGTGSRKAKKPKVSDAASLDKENLNIDVARPAQAAKPKPRPIKKPKDNDSEGTTLPSGVENDAINALLNLKGVRTRAPMDKAFDQVMGFQASDYEDLDQEDAEKENASEVDELESSESSGEWLYILDDHS